MAHIDNALEDQLAKFKDQFENFESTTIVARELSERDQDYDDHIQWTDTEVALLDSRNQAAVVINRVKVKVNLLTGLQTKSATRPKAMPRTPQHEEAADAATEAMRFVTDNNDFDMQSSQVFRNQVVWGYGGRSEEHTSELQSR